MVMQSIRGNSAGSLVIKIFLFSFLLMAVFGLILTDVGGFFRDGTGPSDVAQIGQETITVQQFDRTVRRSVSQLGIPLDVAYQLGQVDRILNGQISLVLLEKAARQYGIQIPDEMLAQQVRDIVTPLTQPGTSAQETFEIILRNQGMTEREFLTTLRQEMAGNILQDVLASPRQTMPVSLLRDIYQYKNETRSIEMVEFLDKDVDDLPAPSEEMLLSMYEGSKEARFEIPEVRDFTLAIIKSDQIEETLDIDEARLRDEYENAIDLYTKPERRVLEQAILSDLATARKIFDDASTGAGLNDAVNTHGAGVSSYLGKQEFNKDGSLLPAVADPVFAADQGAVVGPIETPLGFHVIIVHETLEPEITPFDTVKDDLRQDLIAMESIEQLYSLANIIDDRLAGGDTLEGISEDVGMDLFRFENVNNAGFTEEREAVLEDFQQDRAHLLKTAFELLDGETAPIMELRDGRFAAVRTDRIRARDFRPFDEVRPQIERLWENSMRESENNKRVSLLMTDALSGEKSLAAIARENNASLKIITQIEREKGPLPINHQSLPTIFAMKPGDIDIIRLTNGFAIARLDAIKSPAFDKASADDLEAIRNEWTQNYHNELFSLYLNHRRDFEGVMINEPLLDRMYGSTQDGL